MTQKEKKRLYAVAYNLANKDKARAYYLKNRERILASKKRFRKSLVDGFYTMYYLKEEHYVGVTNQPKTRIPRHKVNGKHTLDYEVIATFKTKLEALNAEKYMHSIGYNGINKHYKR